MREANPELQGAPGPTIDYHRLVQIIRDRFPQRLVPERADQVVTERQAPWYPMEDGIKLSRLVDHHDAKEPVSRTTTFQELGINLAGSPISPEEYADRRLWRRTQYAMAAGIFACGLLVGGAALFGTPVQFATGQPKFCTTYQRPSIRGFINVRICPVSTPPSNK